MCRNGWNAGKLLWKQQAMPASMSLRASSEIYGVFIVFGTCWFLPASVRAESGLVASDERKLFSDWLLS